MPSSEQDASLPGQPAARYTLIPRTLIFLTRGEKWLLLKGAPHKRLWANRYNGVGGHVEPGEDVLSAAQRELKEETGLEASLWLCGVITVDTRERSSIHVPGIGIFLFRGECPQGDPVASEEGQLEWVSRTEIEQHPLVEDLYSLLPRLMALRPGDPPLFVQYSYDEQGRLVSTAHLSRPDH